MKTLFDTIEEISGEEAASVVLETTGFRQGLVVGEYFQNMKGVTVFEAAELITNTYASAGWGKTTIKYLNPESKTLSAELKDSWEHKINVAQKKTKEEIFFRPIMQGFLQDYSEQIFGTR